MHSASLDEVELAALRQSAAASLGKPLERLQRAWRDLQKVPPCDSVTTYGVLPELPENFLLALQHATGAMADQL